MNCDVNSQRQQEESAHRTGQTKAEDIGFSQQFATESEKATVLSVEALQPLQLTIAYLSSPDCIVGSNGCED